MKEEQEERPTTITLPIYFEDLKYKYAAGISGKYLIITNHKDKRKGKIILEPTIPDVEEKEQRTKGGIKEL